MIVKNRLIKDENGSVLWDRHAHAHNEIVFVMAAKDWPVCSKSLKGVILDLCGVLYDCGEGGGVAISGSVEALKKWVSNEQVGKNVLPLAISMLSEWKY